MEIFWRTWEPGSKGKIIYILSQFQKKCNGSNLEFLNPVYYLRIECNFWEFEIFLKSLNLEHRFGKCAT